jgi:hypothetical protein
MDAVLKAKLEMSKPAPATDSETSLFSGEKLKTSLVDRKRHWILVVKFSPECTFELEPVHTSQFVDILKRIK